MFVLLCSFYISENALNPGSIARNWLSTMQYMIAVVFFRSGSAPRWVHLLGQHIRMNILRFVSIYVTDTEIHDGKSHYSLRLGAGARRVYSTDSQQCATGQMNIIRDVVRQTAFYGPSSLARVLLSNNLYAPYCVCEMWFGVGYCCETIALFTENRPLNGCSCGWLMHTT